MEDVLNKHIQDLIEDDINKNTLNLENQFTFETLELFSDDLFDNGVCNSTKVS